MSALRGFAPVVMLASVLASACGGDGEEVRILNVSYDPTREFFRELNAAFAADWFDRTGERIAVDQSHGGSGSQARGVIEGLEADVVTLALAADVDRIARAGVIAPDWRGRLPGGSAPYGSTLVFLVRRGNPKGIDGWDDLARADVQVLTPNPKTSGVARWNYLAMWGAALERELGDGFPEFLKDPERDQEAAAAQAAARAHVRAVFGNVPLLASGARGAMNAFVQNRVGDVLVSWENEILLAVERFGGSEVEIVVPPVSILAEPVVSVVDRTVDARGTREVARAYLAYLYSDEGQEIAARHHYRPLASESVRARFEDRFPRLRLFTIDEVFGGWDAADAEHFADGGTFDQIYDGGR